MEPPAYLRCLARSSGIEAEGGRGCSEAGDYHRSYGENDGFDQVRGRGGAHLFRSTSLFKCGTNNKRYDSNQKMCAFVIVPSPLAPVYAPFSILFCIYLTYQLGSHRSYLLYVFIFLFYCPTFPPAVLAFIFYREKGLPIPSLVDCEVGFVYLRINTS